MTANVPIDPRAWPLALKAPLLVAILMFAVSAVVTNQVLSRLEDTQERHLQQLTSAYLDGLTSALTPAVFRDDVWEVFDNLDRSRAQYRSLNVSWTVVLGDDDLVLAASDPVRFPSQSAAPNVPASLSRDGRPFIDPDHGTASFARDMTYQNKKIGTILAEADIAPLLRERSEVFWTLLLTNVALTLALAVAGFAMVRRMTKPVALLTKHLEAAHQGEMQPVASLMLSRQSAEFTRLFSGYNALVKAVNEREALAAELAEEEKVASLGRLASGMAHEINNPLGGMFNALDALKRHGTREDVRTTSLRLIEQGLTGIRELVRSTLATYRADRALRDLTAADLDDLRLLVKPEAKRLDLTLDWNIEIEGPVAVPALPVRDAALNLLLNACHVSRKGGRVAFKATYADHRLTLEFTDSGSGLPEHVREYIERPGAGSAPLDRRSGLGLWIVKRLCDEMDGRLRVLLSNGNGTIIRLIVAEAGQELRDAA
jgi:signal transduction histidine kinase